jgi:hypothetical protein
MKQTGHSGVVLKIAHTKNSRIFLAYKGPSVKFKAFIAFVRTLEHSFYDYKNKQWSVSDTVYNAQKLLAWGFQFHDEKVKEVEYEISPTPFADIDMSLLPEGLRQYQVDGVRFLEAVDGNGIVADSPRCIDGDALVTINRGGNGRKYKLSDVYRRYKGLDKLNYNYDRGIPTYIRGLKKNGVFGLLQVKDVIFSGKKEVFSISTEDGKVLKATPDHLFYRRLGDVNTWTPLRQLQVGDYIMVNGQEVCPRCGATENLVTYKYAKFRGYCKHCMDHLKRLTTKNIKGSRSISSYDNYVYLAGSQYWDHPRYNHHGIAEHIVVMEKHLGRYVNRWEEVHHINHDRSDNRLDNLKLLSRSEHKAIHEAGKHFGNYTHYSGTEVIMIPKYVQIASIHEGGFIDTYDVMVDQEEHNYIANGIVVHNCGKSIQALSYCFLHPEKRPVIICCPASAKIGWQREIQKWSDAEVAVLYGRSAYETPKSVSFIVINYDILYDWSAYLCSLYASIIIVDEVQCIANRYTETGRVIQRTEGFLNLAKTAEHVIALSGTPITRGPVQFFTILNVLRPELFPDEAMYKKDYCNPKFNGLRWEYEGVTNVSRLRSYLATCMIRRKKKDVFSNLPIEEKIVVPLEVDKDLYKEESEEYEEWFKEHTSASDTEIARRLNLLKSISYDAKRPQILEWIRDFVASREKLVVFCWHRDVCEDLYREFRSMAVMVYGGMDAQKRQKSIDLFQQSDKIRLFVANIKACNTAISLSASDTVAFVELPQTPGDMQQAEERIFIPNDGKKRVAHYYLVAGGTLDEDRAVSLQKRAKTLGKILDGDSGGEIFGTKIKKTRFK